MIKKGITLLSIVCFFNLFAQDYHIGNVDEKLVDFLYYQNYCISNNLHFYIGEDDGFGSIYSLNETTKEFKAYHKGIQNESIRLLFEAKNGIVYNSVIGGLTDLFNITFLGNDGSKKVIESFPFDNSNFQIFGCQFFIGDTMFFQIKEGNQYNLYRYYNNFSQKDLVTVSEHSFSSIKLIDNALFFITLENGNYKFKLFKNNNFLTLETDLLNSYSCVKEVITNDSLSYYFNIAKSNASSLCATFNLQSNVFSTFLNSPIIENPFFTSDTTFVSYSNYLPAKSVLKNGFISQTKSVYAKHNLSAISDPLNPSAARYYSFGFPSENFLVYTNHFGVEPAKIDSGDSITLIADYTSGRASSITSISCGNASSDFYPKSFYFRHETYLCLPNLYDGFYYLCKIKNDSVISIFKFEENNFDINSIEFHPTKDFLYWSVYDKTKKMSRLFKRGWNLPNEVQASVAPDNKLTWYNEFGLDNTNYSCYLTGDNTIVNKVLIDDNNNVYSSSIDRKYGQLYPNSIFYDRNNDTSISVNQMQSIVKFNEFGKLIWYNNIGDRYKFWSDYDKFILNKDQHPTVIGNYYKKGYFDQDSLTAMGSAIYIATLDKNNGKVLYKKNIMTSIYVDDFNISQVILDKNGDIYIYFYYKNYQIKLGDTILLSDWQLQNAVLKIDDLGNIIWAKNINTAYSDYMGFANSVNYDSINNLFQVVYAQDGNYSCEDGWKSELIMIKPSGEIISRDLFLSGNAINGNVVIENIGSDKLFLKGQYSGEIHAEIFTNTTIPSGSCYEYENYELIYDMNLKRFIQAKTSSNNQYLAPFESKTYKDTIYLLGFKNGTQLCMQIYDLGGNFLGEKLFNQFQTNKPENYHFDVKNGYLVLSGYNFQYDSKYAVNPVLNNIYAVSLLRIENKNWDKTDLAMKNMDIYALNQHENISIFPNPVEDVFEVNFNNMDQELTEYQIVDLNGKIVQKGKIENRPFLDFDFSGQKNGIYIFQVSGEKAMYSFKLVKI